MLKCLKKKWYWVKYDFEMCIVVCVEKFLQLVMLRIICFLIDVNFFCKELLKFYYISEVYIIYIIYKVYEK